MILLRKKSSSISNLNFIQVQKIRTIWVSVHQTLNEKKSENSIFQGLRVEKKNLIKHNNLKMAKKGRYMHPSQKYFKVIYNFIATKSFELKCLQGNFSYGYNGT